MSYILRVYKGKQWTPAVFSRREGHAILYTYDPHDLAYRFPTRLRAIAAQKILNAEVRKPMKFKLERAD